MSRKILGLDIRRDSLAAVLVQGTLQGYVIEQVAHIDSRKEVMGPGGSVTLADPDPNLPESEGEERGERLLAMLEKLAQTMDLASADCFVSFPAIDMSFRNLSVPFRNRKKIRQVLPFELEPVMPGSVDELAFDFIMLERNFEEEESQLVSAVVNKNLLESFESCLKRGGLSVQAVLPGGAAAAEFLAQSCEEHRDYLFLDLGHQAATLYLIRNREVTGIRAFAMDSAKGAGLNVMRTVLAFCEQNDIDYQPTMLYLTGPGARVAGARDILIRTTSLDVTHLDSLQPMGFMVDERITDLWDTDLYQNAMALCHSGIYGIKGLRLSERFVALNKYLSEYRSQMIQTGFFFALVFLALLASTLFDSISTNRTLRDYDRQMRTIFTEAFPSATKIIDPYSQMQANVREVRKKSAFADSNAGNIRIIDLVNDISQALPEGLDIEFDRFVLGSEDLKISGNTDTFATVEDMKTRLARIDYFSSVVITSTTGDQGGNKVNFKLKIDF